MNPYQGYRNPAQNTYEDDNRHYDDNDQYEDQGYEGGHYGQQQGYGHEEEYEYYQPAKNQNVQGKSDRSFQKGTRNEEASFQGGSSNRGFYQPKDQKQMYEEDDVHHDDRNRGRPEDQKESGKIAETIDTTKVKNSKLFQKFLQNENKEVPNKPPKDIKPALKANNYSANKDSKDAPKTKFTSNTPTQQQGFRANEDPYYRRDQDFSNEDSHYRDKSHPTYDTSDAYGPPSKESLSPGRDKGNFFPNREENQYEYGYDPRGPEVDLNYHSSSKLVSLQNPEATPQNFQGFPPQNMPYFYPNPYQYMGYGMPPEGQQPQHPQFPMDPNEVFMLRAQVMELNQALAREIEANKALDSKCTEYLTQLEKSAENFEEFKRKIQDQGSGHEEEIFHMENKIKNLSDNLQEKERIEEQQTAEINKLRRKIDAELESRGQLLEEHEDLERKRYEELERVKREIEQKEEEIQRLRRETDHSKHDRDNSRVMEERYLKDIKGLKGEIMELNRANEDLKKTCDDKQQQINLGKMEINSLRDQLETMDGQYRDLLAENDRIKRDNFTQKEKLLAAESELKSLRMTLEKLQIDKTQASEALFRAEKALDRERQITADLKLQVSSSNNQWEGPSNYGSRRTGQREYEDDRDQPYRQKESGPRDNYRENVQETNTYEPRREAPKQQYAPQKEEEYQYKPRRPGSGSFAQQQSSQENFRDTPQQTNPKYGGRSDENTPKVGQRQQVEERSYQQQQQQQMPKENKYDDRYNRGAALPPKNQQQEQNRKANEDPYDRNAGRNISGNKSLVQNEPNYGMPVPKLTSQNQVYKPTHNLLAWDEPPAVENKPVNRARDQRQQDPTPPRERPQTAQTRQERDDNQYGSVNKKPQTRGPDAPNQPYAKEEKSYQDFTKEVKTLETDLMNFQMQKDNLTNEMQRLDKVKIKSGANIKRKQEIESDMNQLQTNISNVKNRLRELHALHPY